MKAGRIAMGLIYIGVAVAHWKGMRLFASIVPDYLPAHCELVIASGAIAGVAGVGVMIPATRRPAAWVIFIWLLAVLPANVWMAQHPERYRPIPEWMFLARLPFQLPLLWWAWLYTRPEPRTSISRVRANEYRDQ